MVNANIEKVISTNQSWRYPSASMSTDQGNYTITQTFENFYYIDHLLGFDIYIHFLKPDSDNLSTGKLETLIANTTDIFCQININSYTTGFTLFEGNISQNKVFNWNDETKQHCQISIPYEDMENTDLSQGLYISGTLTFQSIISTGAVQAQASMRFIQKVIPKKDLYGKIYYQTGQWSYEWFDTYIYTYQNNKWIPVKPQIFDTTLLLDYNKQNIVDLGDNQLYTIKEKTEES